MAGLPTPPNIVALRKQVESPLNAARNEVDPRDVHRLMTDDEYASLFLQWTKSEEDSAKLVMKCLKWRHEKKVNDLTPESVGEDALKKGYIFLLGQSIRGSRVLHFRAGKLEKKDRETSMKLLIFWLERIQRREPGELITFILDTTDTSVRNSDMGFVSFVIECFTTFFPCLLERLIVYNLPGLVNSIWRLVGKMLSPEQREATVLCGKEEILQYIDAEFIPLSMGGKSTFQYSYPPFPDDLDKEM